MVKILTPLVEILEKIVNNTEKARQRETESLLSDMKMFLSYDPCSGNIVFLDNRFGAKQIGQVAGYVDKGYVRFFHKNKQYMAHRVAWALYHGRWPKHTIDHINRDGTDNRIQNLRDVPQAVNNRNKSKYKKKTLDESL